jgi:hypothetical protein
MAVLSAPLPDCCTADDDLGDKAEIVDGTKMLCGVDDRIASTTSVEGITN